MANRFWVGGSGTWNTTNTANWSTTSGGASGASVPTAADAVIFNGSSGTGTITFATTQTCLSITGTGSTFSTTGSASLSVAGSITTPATFDWTGATGTITITAASTLTINSAVTPNITINTTAGVITQLGAALECGNTFTHTQGTFTTNNNTFTVFQYSGGTANTKVLNLGSSQVNVSYNAGLTAWDSSGSGLTVNAGTSVISFRTGASYTVALGTKTYNTINFDYLPASFANVTTTFIGAATIANLSLRGPGSVGGFTNYVFTNAPTITGTFSSTNTTSSGRIWVKSSATGTAVTITAAAVSLTDVDFSDITAAGTASPFTGTRLGNAQGNTNITFTSKTVYWNLNGTNSWGAVGWAASSGGTPDAIYYPLPQDTAIFDNSFALSATVNVDAYYSFPNLDMSARTNAMTLAFSLVGATCNSFGDFILGSGVAVTSAGAVTFNFADRATQTITGNGVSLPGTIAFVVVNISGTTLLGGAITFLGSINLTSGTLSLSSYTLTCAGFNSANSNVRTLAFGTGNIAVTGTNGTVWLTSTVTNFTTSGSQVVNLTDNTAGSMTLSPGSLPQASAITFNRTAGGGTFTISTLSNVRSLDFTGYSGSWSATSTTYYGGLTLSPTMTISGTSIQTFAFTSGTQVLKSNGKSATFGVTVNGVGGTLQLFDAFTTTATNSSLTGGTLDLNGKTFTCGRYSITGTTTKGITSGTGGAITVTSTGTVFDNSTGSTGTTITGDLVVNVTNATATACTVAPGSVANGIASFNFTAGTYALTLLGGNVKDLDFTGWAGTVALPTLSLYGSLTIPPTGGTFTAAANTLTFAATTGTEIITTNGRTLDYPVTFNGVGGTFQLAGNLTLGTTRTATLTAGTLDLNNNTLTCNIFSSSAINNRVIAFGTTGQINITGTGTTILDITTATSFSYTGTSNVRATYSGALGTRTITPPGSNGNINNALSIYVTGGTDTVTITSNTFLRNLDFTGFSGTLTNNIKTIYGNLTISTGMTLTAGALTTTFATTSGTQVITSNGKTHDYPITFNGAGGTFQLADNLTTGNTRVVTLTNGTLDLNSNVLTCGGFNSNTSATRTLAFGTSGSITINGTTATAGYQLVAGIWTVTGTNPVVNFNAGTSAVTKNVGSGSNLVSFNFLSGTDGLAFITNFTCKNIDFTGYSGSVSWSGTGSLLCYGNLKLSAGMSFVASSTMAFGFYGSSGTSTVTSNGQTIPYNVTVDSAGKTWQVVDTMTVDSTKTLTFTNGTLQLLASGTTTVGTFATSGTTLKYLRSTVAGTQATISQTTGTVDVTYLDIKDSNATGGATWNALPANGNVNSGNNTGWNFAGIVFTADITESVSASEVQNFLYQAFVNITESSTATDAQSTSWVTSSAITESSTATATQSTSWVTSSAIVETATLTDTQNAGFVLSASLGESVSISDVQAYVNIFNSAITENITLSEAIDKQAILFASISESSTATAIQGAQAVFTGQLSESVTASSLESATVALNAAIAEQISASDLAVPTVIFSVAIVEPVTATETQDRTAVLFASRAESTTATDTQSATTAFNVIRSESTTIDIIQSVTFTANASATELMQVTDSPYAAMYKLLEILAAKQHVLSAEPYVYNVSASPVVGSVTPIVEDSGIQVTAEVIYPTIH